MKTLFTVLNIATLSVVLLGGSVDVEAAKGEKGKASANPVVSFETNLGTFKAELYPDKAPITVKNFLAYVESGFFKGTIFHRVIPSFMIQGGGFDEKMVQKTTKEPIKNEADNGLKNEDGTLAMARTAIVDSATAQFFINVKSNDFLNHKDKSSNGYGYAVFGKVTDGMDIIRKIEKTPTGTQGFHSDVPKTPIVIKNVTVK
jgi:peptidyl-prolyl cis-trans isomerase B (cyclophilin B)